MSREVDRILEEEVKAVKVRHVTTVDTKNGLPIKDKVDVELRRFISYAIGSWKDELVTTKQNYPVDGVMRIEMDIDVMILKRSDFIKLKKAYKNG